MAKIYFVAQAMWMVVGGGSTLYLRYRVLDRRVAPGRKFDAVLWLSFVIMLTLGIYAIYQKLAQK